MGGIEDTIKPMEKSLRMHELRPYDYLINYKEEIRSLNEENASGHETGGKGGSGHKPRRLSTKSAEHAKVLSASPFRATV